MKRIYLIVVIAFTIIFISSCEKESIDSNAFLAINDYKKVDIRAHGTLIA